MNQASEIDTRLHGVRLHVARGLWLVLVGLVLLMYGIVSYEKLFNPLTVCDTTACGMTPTEFTAWQTAGLLPETGLFLQTLLNGIVMPLAFFIIAAVIAWRRSDDWMALLVSFALVGLGPYLLAGTNFALSARPGWDILCWIILSATLFCFVAVFYLFPDGRSVPRWTRWLLLVLGVLLIASGFTDASGIWVVFVFCFIGIATQVYRYRRLSTPVQRQQTKWVIVGLLGPIIALLLWNTVFQQLRGGSLSILWMLPLLPIMALLDIALPLSIGFAMLRYRLWDIDILIRRTVTYALVTALLVVVFFGCIIGLQQIFSTLTGSGQSELVTVLSTLAIAALFVPLRNRIQNVIDRRFNRTKYNAQQVMQQFGETVRDETDLENLSGNLMNVVSETMQPKTVSIWLRRDPKP